MDELIKQADMPEEKNTKTSFGNMLKQKTHLKSIQDVVQNKNLSKSKKLMSLVSIGYAMEDAKALLNTFKPKEEVPSDVFLDSSKAPQPKQKKPKFKVT